MIDCIIVAGGGNGELVQSENVENKALIPLGGRPMICHVLGAFRQLDIIRRIIIVGPLDELSFAAEEFQAELIAEEGTILNNLLAASRLLDQDAHLLISSADIPLVSPEAVTDFVNKCYPYEDDFYYPIISREKSETLFPGVSRTYVHFLEGTFTGGNIFLVNAAKIEPTVPKMEKFLKDRKNPLKLIALLGPATVLKFLRKKASISYLEKRFSSLLDLQSRAVFSDYPALGFDVDKPSDLEQVKRFMGLEE